MAFVNNHTPEPEIPELRLVPFIPRVHAVAYLDGIRGHESMFKRMPTAFEHANDFLRYVERRRRDKSALLFAVIDTTRPDRDHPEWEGSLAGVIGLLGTNKKRLVTEICPTIVLPTFQRAHVASHAVGLLIKYVLDLQPSGLGFRKIKRVASPMNTASNNLVERLGFKLEGVSRWNCVIPVTEGHQKLGKEARAGDAGNGLLGDDANEWAVCWDD